MWPESFFLFATRRQKRLRVGTGDRRGPAPDLCVPIVTVLLMYWYSIWLILVLWFTIWMEIAVRQLNVNRNAIDCYNCANKYLFTVLCTIKTTGH
jgi:hypothetical protein